MLTHREHKLSLSLTDLGDSQMYTIIHALYGATSHDIIT